MKVNSNRLKARLRLMVKKLKNGWLKKRYVNLNQLAKNEQLRHAAILLLILVISVGFYRIEAHPQRAAEKQEEASFDGAFDAGFNKDSDEALIEKQQRELNALKNTVEENAKNTETALKENAPDAETKVLLDAMQVKLTRLEGENQKTNEQLQVALMMNAQGAGQGRDTARPLSREEMEARRIERQKTEREIYRNAGLETVRFNSRKKAKTEARTARNYVWAGSFFEGVMLTGIQGDAGINGSKNMGTALVRLTSDGIMPNEQRSHLRDCFVLVSSYGDLSASSVVLHVETVSCAGKIINFEQKAYGAIFDMDAMQDLRGTSILKTKPLLGYSAAAGMLAGFGDGLRNYNTAQTINPSVGTITAYGTATALGQSAAGGALSNPANRISDYIMKIADIYHPLVVARAGRHVSVLFTKGFWIDKEHQVYESGKAIDEASRDDKESNVTTTVSRASNVEQSTDMSDAPQNTNSAMATAPNGAADFMRQSNASAPLFSTLNNGATPHG